MPDSFVSSPQKTQIKAIRLFRVYTNLKAVAISEKCLFQKYFLRRMDVSCFASVANELVPGNDKFQRVVVTTFALALSGLVDNIYGHVSSTVFSQ